MDRKAMFVMASAMVAEATPITAYDAYMASYASLWGMFPAGENTMPSFEWCIGEAQVNLRLASIRLWAEEQHAKRAAAAQ